MQLHGSVKKLKNQSEKYLDGDVRVTTCETAWMHRKHTVNVLSEIGATVTVDGVDVDVDRVAEPPY